MEEQDEQWIPPADPVAEEGWSPPNDPISDDDREEKVRGAFAASIEGKKLAGKLPLQINKKFEPEIDEFLSTEQSQANDLGKKEMEMWAATMVPRYKGLAPEVAEKKFKADWDTKAKEITDRLNADLKTRYSKKLLDLEKASMMLSEGKAPDVKKDASWYSALGKRVKDVFANQVPKIIQLQNAVAGPTGYDELMQTSSERPNPEELSYLPLKTQVPSMEDFADISGSKQYKKATLPNGIELDIPSIMEEIRKNPNLPSAEARADYFDTKYLRPALAKDRQEAYKKAQVQMKESEELLADVPQEWDDVKFGDNFMSYISGSLGQGLATSGLALGTAGTMAFALERGNVLEEGINAKAQQLSKLSGFKITPEDVIASGDYGDVLTLANSAGGINSALEVAGSMLGLGKLATGILGKKLTGSLLRAGVVGFGGEASTEAAQEIVSTISSKMAGGKGFTEAWASLDDKDFDKIIESLRQGGINGLVFGGSGQAISNVRGAVGQMGEFSNMPTTGDQQLDEAQVRMFRELTAVPEAVTLNEPKIEPNAIQEQTTGQVPVQPKAGGSQEVPQAQSQSEPQAPAPQGEVKVENAPSGVFVNVGMLRGTTSAPISREEIVAALPADVSVLESSVVEGTEPTLSIKLSRPLNEAEMAEFLTATEQKAIPQLIDGAGKIHGSTEWGDFNPEFFVMPGGQKLSQLPKLTQMRGFTSSAPGPNKPGRTRLTMGDTDLYVTETSKGFVLDRVETPVDKRGQGSARRAMEALTAEADEQGKSITLQVSPDKDTDRTKLVNFYRSLGFDGDEVFMRRLPPSETTKERLKTKRLENEKAVLEVERAEDTDFTSKARTVIANALKEGSITPEQERAMQGLLNNASGKNYTPKTRKAFLDGLRQAMGVPVEVVTTDVRSFVESIKDQIRGIKFGGKMARAALKEDIGKKVNEMMKRLNIPSAKAKTIIRRITGVNINSDNQVNKLIDYLSDLARKIETDNIYQEAVRRRAQLKDKIGSIPASFQDDMKFLANIDLREVDPQEYLDQVLPVLASLQPVTSKGYAMADMSGPTAYAQREKLAASTRLRAELEAMGISTKELNDAQVQSLIGYIEETDPFAGNAADAAKVKANDKLMEAYDNALMGLEESGQSGPLYDALTGLDPEYLDGKTMVRLIKAMDNLSVNGDDSGTGRLVAEYQSQQAHKKVAGTKLSGVKIKEDRFFTESQTHYIGELFRLIFGNIKKAVNILDVSGITERVNQESNADRITAEFVKSLDKIVQQAKKHTKFDDTSVRRTSMIGRLLGHPPDGDPQKTFERMVANEQASITAKREAGMTQDANEEEKFLSEVPLGDREKFEQYVRAKYPWEMKLLEAAIKKFEELGPEYKKATMVNFDVPFVLQKMYTPHVQFNVAGAKVDSKGRIRGKGLPKPKLAGSAMDRTYSLAPGNAYSNNFLIDMGDALREQLRQIHVVPAQNRVDAFFRDPRSVELFGGKEARDAAVNTYKAMHESFEGSGHTNNFPKLGRILDLIQGLSQSIAFGGPLRYPLQYFPPLVNLIGHLRGDVDLAFVSVPKEFKLAEESTLGNRSASQGGLNTNSADFNYHLSNLNLDADAFTRMMGLFEKGKEKVTSGQIKGDIHSAYRAFAAYYLQSLRQQGVDISNIDLSEEHLKYKDDPKRMKAFNYAQGAVDTFMGTSYAKTLPSMLQTRSLAGKALKNLLFAMSTFSFQQKQRMYNDLKLMFRGDMQQRKEALGDLASSVGENAAFQAVRIYGISLLLNEGSYGLMDAMGWQYPERDEEKEKRRRAIDFQSTVAYDAMPGIITIPDQVRTAFLNQWNSFAFELAKEEDPNLTLKEWKEEGNSVYVPQKGDFADFAGMYGIFLRSLGGAIGDIQSLWEAEDGEIMVRMKDDSEKSLELNDDQKQALEFVIFTEALASTGMSIGELTKMGQKIKSETLKQIKEDNK